MTGEFWLTDERFAGFAPLLPSYMRAVAQVDDRRMISGIVQARLSAGSTRRPVTKDALQSLGPVGEEGRVAAGFETLAAEGCLPAATTSSPQPTPPLSASLPS